MDIKWKKTNAIEKLLTRAEVAKALIQMLPSLPAIEQKLQRESLLKSSLFSAKIEGNTLSYSQIESLGSVDPKEQEKKEVANILKAITLMRNIHNNLTIEVLKKTHSVVMDGLSSESGKLRAEPSAIFNMAGIAVYMTPPPKQIIPLLEDLLQFINQSGEDSATLVNGAISHYQFEKIHPFLDGNGRVGRLISSLHIKKLGYDFKNLVFLEEYLLENRDRYYYGLSLQKTDITEFVELFLTAIVTSAESVIEKLQNKKEDSIEDTLLPRRSEILSIIREHTMMSFDQIRRRFLIVGERSLHNDLKILVKMGLIKKLGVTRGAVYTPAG